MTPQYENTDLDRVFSEIEENRPAGRGRLVRRALLLLLALVAVAGALVYWIVGSRERQVMADLAHRSAVLASTRVEVLQAWLGSLGAAGSRLGGSDLFRLFAAEAGSNGGAAIANPVLAAQVPYMVQAVTEFGRQEGMTGVYLLGSDGRAILASGGAPDLVDSQREAARIVFESKRRAVTPLRQVAEGLVIDVLMPVAPPQEPNPQTPASVAGVFVFTLPVHGGLADMLRPSALLRTGEITRVFQTGPTGVVEIAPGARPVLARVAVDGLVPGQALAFARRPAVGTTAPVFSSGAWIPSMPWIAVHETSASVALAPLYAFASSVLAVAVFVVLSIVTGFVAFWWRQEGEHNAALATQYQMLGARIAAQRRFLGSLMNTATELIGLKRKDGVYTYANPAFGEAVGRAAENIPGLDDIEVFGRGTAERLRHSDQRALASAKPVVVEEVVHLPAGQRHFQMSKVPYREQNGEVSGILMVARDVTEIFEAEQRRQRGIQAMTQSFVRTIEQIDPYLSGHSYNVRDLGVAIAKGLNLSADDVTTIGIAAMLAQVGKLSVPKEIVAKTERLTLEEYRLMQGHVGHALTILRDVDFGLPVVEAIAQMYERLDGSGYPNKLSGDRIALPARVLAVADVFSARLETRSYRTVISAEEALKVLADHPERYDAAVVAALRDFLQTIDGEKLVARIQGK